MKNKLTKYKQVVKKYEKDKKEDSIKILNEFKAENENQRKTQANENNGDKGNIEITVKEINFNKDVENAHNSLYDVLNLHKVVEYMYKNKTLNYDI